MFLISTRKSTHGKVSCLLTLLLLVAGKLHANPNPPDWAIEVNWYQIFPERFANGDDQNNPTRQSLADSNFIPPDWAVTPWETPWVQRAPWEEKMSSSFHETLFYRRYGGDLQGVIDKLDYLVELGITGIYFNPLFHAPSLHKYDGSSFHHIDPHFGPDPQGDLRLIQSETSNPRTWNWTAADKLFLQLIKEAKARGIRIIIDGVWNHTGREFFAFRDIRTKHQKSRFASWYDITKFDDPRTPRNEFAYRGWHGYQSLPEFANLPNGSNLMPGPKNYIFNATARWMDPNQDGNPNDGIDGWRLDVAEEIPTGFWQEWHAHVRSINPQAYTVAEIWGPPAEFIKNNHFDAAMNYHGFAIPVKGWLIDGKISAGEFAKRLRVALETQAFPGVLALQNLVDSHDTQRLASAIANRDTYPDYINVDWFDYDEGSRVNARSSDYKNGTPDADGRRIWKMTALLQATFPGAPMIYYGTEIGMHGADDPEDRMPTPWHQVDRDILNCYQSVLQLRKASEVLRRGDFRIIEARDEAQCFVFERYFEGKKMVIALNRGKQPVHLGDYLNGMTLRFATSEVSKDRTLPYLSAAIYEGEVKPTVK
jgi:glycosidase